jgi:regulator of nonsense transcripts 3
MQQHHGTEHQLKIVIRRLPPKLPEEIFRKVISQFVSLDGKHCDIEYFRYVPGKAKAIGNPLQPEQHSIAYMRFLTMEKLLEFTERFNGWKFQSKSGDVHFAAVEYSPNQAVPVNNQHEDPQEGTILIDPFFTDFVDQLHREGLESVMRVEEPKMMDDLGSSKMTPLLEYLNRRKQKQSQASLNQQQQQQGKSKKGSRSNKPTQILKRNTQEQPRGTSAAGERDPNTKNNSSKKKGKFSGPKKKVEGSTSTDPSQNQPKQQEQQTSQEGQTKKPKKKRYPKKNKANANTASAPAPV